MRNRRFTPSFLTPFFP